MNTLPTRPSPTTTRPPARLRTWLKRAAAATVSALLSGTPFWAFPQANPTSVPVLVADFNHDGLPDALVLAPGGAPSATIAFGTLPYGTFSTPRAVTFPAACTSIPTDPGNSGFLSAVDFNNDGFPDLLFTCSTGTGLTTAVMLGVGDGTFAAPVTLTSLTTGSSVAADFDHDGKLDVVSLVTIVSATGARTPTLYFFHGNGDGTFAAPIASALGTSPTFQPGGLLGVNSISVADVDGDGYPDLALTASFGGSATSANGATLTLNLFGNRKDGTFGSASAATRLPDATANLGTYNGGAAGSAFFAGSIVGSFTGMGTQDFVLANRVAPGGILLVKNTSTSSAYSLAAPVTTPTASVPLAAAAATITGRPVTDLLVSSTDTVSVLANDGAGNFSASYPTLSVTLPSASTTPLFAAADANGDGYTDVYTATSDTALHVSVNLVNGSATATSQPFTLPTGTSPIGAAWNGNALFAGSSATGSETVSVTAIPVTLTWPAPASITYGTPLGAAQLNATATDPTGAPVAGSFIYTPAAGTVLDPGSQTLNVAFTPADSRYLPATATNTVVVTQATPRITWPAPAAIAYGTPLGAAQLNATATGIGGAALPGTFTYTPAAGAVLAPGTQTLRTTFTPADAVRYAAASASVQLTVTGPALAALAPSTIALGSPATTITLTGTGFVANSVARVNGAALPTSYVNPTTLTATLPASLFLSTGNLSVTVLDPDINATTNAQNLSVGTGTPSVTLTGPLATQPGSQPTVALTITNPFPLALTATFTLSFTASGGSGVDDPAIQFAAGGRTLSLSIPANSTVVPPVQLQAGTDAGTITIPVVLTAGGANVTPAGLGPLVITVPAAVPTLATATLTRGDGTFSVAIHGYSNTREVTTAKFHFVAAPGATINTPDITADVTSVFNGWFGSAASQAFGSTFTYTQVFNSDNPASIQSVEVTLTNSVGVSLMSTAQ